LLVNWVSGFIALLARIIIFDLGLLFPLSPPRDATKELITELEQLRNLLKETQSQAEQAQDLAEQQTQALLSAEQKVLQEAEEKALWEQLAHESEEERAKLKYELSELQKNVISPQQTAKIISFADRAAAKIDLNEKETREIIDQQLRDRGLLYVVPLGIMVLNFILNCAVKESG
jgi:type I restriction enzyme R subunit